VSRRSNNLSVSRIFTAGMFPSFRDGRNSQIQSKGGRGKPRPRESGGKPPHSKMSR